jgi:hypothetical protein
MTRAAEEKLAIASRVQRWRVPKNASAPPRALGVRATAPFDPSDPSSVSSIEAGDAIWVVPLGLDERATPWDLVALLPEPEAVRGALVVMAPVATRAGFFARLLGSEPAVARAVRGSALLLKGYGAIGGGRDPASGLDLVWGE